jgi:phospholipase D1/2
MATRDSGGLLAPIILNAPPIPRKPNGTAKQNPQQYPNPIPTLISLEPSPLPKRNSRNLSQLEEMEPPPPIPAALEDPGYRSRPNSVHSLRWKEHDETLSDDGYLTPVRRSSVGSASTTGWAENSPGGSSPAGPSNSTRTRWRRGGFFKGPENNSTASVDGGDEMDYVGGTSTPRSRRSALFQTGNSPPGDYSAGEELETPVAVKRPGFFQRLKNFGGSSGGVHGRSLSGWTVDTMDDSATVPPFTPGAASSPGIGSVVDEGAESEDLPTRTRSYSPAQNTDTMSAPATPRLGISRLRRRATVTSGGEDGNDTDRSRSRYAFSRRPSFRNRVSKRRSTDGERPSYMPNYKDSAAKWRALKAGIRMIGKRQKEESKIDREKSAELVAELSAGTPAAVILASMFQRDEHGQKRIPILLEQLKVKITDSHHSQKGAGRAQTTFRLELEYGSGLTRMKWVIHREFRDFFNLHSRYRLANISDSTFAGKEAHRLPKFPRGTIPYLRGVRGLGSDDEYGEADQSNPEAHPVDPGLVGPSSPAVRSKRMRLVRRMSSAHGEMEHAAATGIGAGLAAAAAAGGTSVQQAMHRREGFNIRQRQQLEEYLRKLIRIMIFRPDSNRLCKFLELSALGVRLAAEGTYHGKEGYLIIRSSKGSDFRRPWNPSQMARRHAPKWFLVRHSYIVCVDSPEEMNIYDVFIVDSNFSVDSKRFLRKKPKDLAIAPSNPARPQHHRLTIQNHERTVKLLAKNDRQLQQFHQSIEYMQDNTVWAKQQRFGSFAPVRKGVFAQWLVDGRDYFWNVSRAISMAKDVIYIHDWWLSPELVRASKSIDGSGC